jgi:hypothetical protein
MLFEVSEKKRYFLRFHLCFIIWFFRKSEENLFNSLGNDFGIVIAVTVTSGNLRAVLKILLVTAIVTEKAEHCQKSIKNLLLLTGQANT